MLFNAVKKTCFSVTRVNVKIKHQYVIGRGIEKARTVRCSAGLKIIILFKDYISLAHGWKDIFRPTISFCILL